MTKAKSPVISVRISILWRTVPFSRIRSLLTLPSDVFRDALSVEVIIGDWIAPNISNLVVFIVWALIGPFIVPIAITGNAYGALCAVNRRIRKRNVRVIVPQYVLSVPICIELRIALRYPKSDV